MACCRETWEGSTEKGQAETDNEHCTVFTYGGQGEKKPKPKLKLSQSLRNF